jgi:hypothetical protein
MACDLAFATENAAFAQPEILINIPTGDQSGVTPGRKIGQPTPENAKNLTQRSNAIFLDGSDLSFLMVEGIFIARPAPSKNKTNVVGIGFKY